MIFALPELVFLWCSALGKWNASISTLEKTWGMRCQAWFLAGRIENIYCPTEILSKAPQSISSTSNYWLSWLTYVTFKPRSLVAAHQLFAACLLRINSMQCMTAFLGFLLGVEEWFFKCLAIWRGKNTPRDCEERRAVPFDARK
jgi:hypothetical protein